MNFDGLKSQPIIFQIPVGEKLHMNIDYKGAPKPLVFWKFKEGLPIEGEADEREEKALEPQGKFKIHYLY